MGWIKNVTKSVLFVLISCVIFLGALEIFLRVLHPFEFRVKGNKIILPANRTYVIDSTIFPDLERTIVNRKNTLGFRGQEPPRELGRYLTIIAIGGSGTECLYLTEGKTWVDRLAERLRRDFRDVWVNNAGLDGHSTFGHLVLMEDYIAKLRPKVGLFMVGVNDVAKEGFSPFDKVTLRKKLTINTWQDLLPLLAYHSEAFSLFLNIDRLVSAKRKGVAHKALRLNEKGPWVSDETRARIVNEHKTKYLPAFASRVRALIRLSRENGIEPVFISQPALYGDAIDDMTHTDLGKVKVGDATGSIAWEILELYHGVVRDVAFKESALFINLADEMPKSTRYFYDFHHVNNAGAEKEAELIYRDLRPFLSKRYGGYVKTT